MPHPEQPQLAAGKLCTGIVMAMSQITIRVKRVVWADIKIILKVDGIHRVSKKMYRQIARRLKSFVEERLAFVGEAGVSILAGSGSRGIWLLPIRGTCAFYEVE